MNLALLLVIAITVGAVVFGVMTLVSGGDPGLRPVEPDSRAHPLPAYRPLVESDVSRATFDLTWRGYRMDQVDQTLRRLAYDLGYKTELIQVLEAEIVALREGRLEDADTLSSARAASLENRRPEPIVEPEDDAFAVEAPSNVATSTEAEAAEQVDADFVDEPEDETDEAPVRSPRSGVA